jgi:hypothetical protein
LGSELPIRRVALDWDPACGSSFTVRIHPDSAGGASQNPDDWTTIARVDDYAQAGQGIDGPDQFFDFASRQAFLPGNVSPSAVASIETNVVRARYVMVHVTATAPGFNHVSVWEMQIDGSLGITQSSIRSVALEGGGFRITVEGIPGRDYEVQRALSLDGPWTTLGTITPDGEGVANYLDPGPRGQMAFYRLHQL